MSDTAETRPSRGASAAPASTSPTGERYRLIERLDEGAMGVVWVAEDTALHRRVAVKLLHDRFLGAELQEQLAREARAMARLSHPNVVAVFDVGQREGRAFVAMELVEGQPLSRWLERPRRWPEVLEVFRGVAAGLAAAHAAGVVHRDIKPSNILIGDDGRPRIADFGVAHAGRRAGGDAPATTTSTRGLIGSPAYMPPERLHGDPAGERGDQFGFCAALYEALHGERPFQAQTVDGLIAAIRRGPPPPLRDAPRWLHRVIARGLAADPEARFPSMAALAEALREPPARARGGLLVIAGIAAGAAVAAAAVLVLAGPGDRPEAPPLVAEGAGPEPGLADAAVATTTIADAAPPDAAPAPPPPDAAPPRRRKAGPAPKGPSLASLTPEELKARFQELRAAMEAAGKAKEYAKASRIAEELVPVARRYRAGPPGEYEKLVVTYACLAGDRARARARFPKIPSKHPIGVEQERRTAVEICRRHDIELEDLLED